LKKVVVLIPDAESILAPLVVDCLVQKSEIRLVLISQEKKAALRYSRIVDTYVYYGSENSIENWFNQIQLQISIHHVDVVMPLFLSDERYDYYFLNREKLNAKTIPMADPRSFKLVKNKLNFGNWLQSNTIKHPTLYNLYAIQNGQMTLSSIKFPVLLKPIHGAGGIGIKKINTGEELFTILNDKINIENYLCQTFIKGQDLGCGALCFNGLVLAITTQSYFGEPTTDYTTPFLINISLESDVVQLVAEIVSKLNWTGLINFDLLRDGKTNELFVLEANPRFWRSIPAAAAAGVNFPYLACIVAIEGSFNECNFANFFPTTDKLPSNNPSSNYSFPRYFKPTSYGNSKGALFWNLKRLIHFYKEPFQFIHSPIQIWVTDPLPKLYDLYRIFCLRLKNIIKRNFRIFNKA